MRLINCSEFVPILGLESKIQIVGAEVVGSEAEGTYLLMHNYGTLYHLPPVNVIGYLPYQVLVL